MQVLESISALISSGLSLGSRSLTKLTRLAKAGLRKWGVLPPVREPQVERKSNTIKPVTAERRITMAKKNAATKAWETRRAQADAKKRSDAAKKAWATRRANEAAAKRSAAAKKAWATRRKAK